MKCTVHLKNNFLLAISLHAINNAKTEYEFTTDIPKFYE
jgi:hypothetical protein